MIIEKELLQEMTSETFYRNKLLSFPVQTSITVNINKLSDKPFDWLGWSIITYQKYRESDALWQDMPYMIWARRYGLYDMAYIFVVNSNKSEYFVVYDNVTVYVCIESFECS